MQCAKCGSDNPAGKKFCGDCGARLRNSCPKCGAENPKSKKFCGDCGAALDSGAAPVRADVEPHEGPTGERRHLTVLFATWLGPPGSPRSLIPRNGARP
jgi:predicted amidophosphoribosyltransferase